MGVNGVIVLDGDDLGELETGSCIAGFVGIAGIEKSVNGVDVGFEAIGLNSDVGAGVGFVDRAVASAGFEEGSIGPLILSVLLSSIDDGVATGSEKTGSVFVVLVISSIAFCKSLSIVWFWSIFAHLY